jgi:hypothetical protein
VAEWSRPGILDWHWQNLAESLAFVNTRCFISPRLMGLHALRQFEPVNFAEHAVARDFAKLGRDATG